MRVDQVLAQLRDQVADLSLQVSEPVYALSSWYVDLVAQGFRVTVEYAPTLGLFGLSTTPAEGTEEIYRDPTEVVERVKALWAKRRPCSPGKISFAAYEWAKQEMDRLPVGTDSWVEHAAIVKAFESRPTVVP